MVLNVGAFALGLSLGGMDFGVWFRVFLGSDLGHNRGRLGFGGYGAQAFLGLGFGDLG